MAYMDQEFIVKIKTILEQDKTRLEKELDSFADRNTHNVDDYQSEYPDFGSEIDENAQEVIAFEDRLSLERTLESELRDIKSSLQKIKAGTYGVCKYCGKEIDKDRLQARPTSSSCVDCKKKFKGEV